MIDILFLSHNRLDFTKAVTENLIPNTDWNKVRLIRVHDDGSTDGTQEYLESVKWPVPREFRFNRIGGPVAGMNAYLKDHDDGPEIFCKLDNDVLVPHGWLGDCLRVMDHHRELDLLGIECTTDFPEPAPFYRSYEPAGHIGGIGLMRRRAFAEYGLPVAEGRQGFTQWQTKNAMVIKGWLAPSLPVALLDHLPMDPWRSLSEEYIEKSWQRRGWGEGDVQYYGEKSHRLWDWWLPQVIHANIPQLQR